MSEVENQNCPCGSQKIFSACCKPYLDNKEAAPTAEALMRSRYSAYVVQNVDHLQRTLTRSERRTFNRKEALQWARSSTWKGLEIIATEKGLESDADGTVEFIARYEIDGEDKEHHEKALFRKNKNQWLYVTGDIL